MYRSVKLDQSTSSYNVYIRLSKETFVNVLISFRLHLFPFSNSGLQLKNKVVIQILIGSLGELFIEVVLHHNHPHPSIVSCLCDICYRNRCESICSQHLKVFSMRALRCIAITAKSVSLNCSLQIIWLALAGWHDILSCILIIII